MKCYALFMGFAPCVFNSETGELLDIPFLGWITTLAMWVYRFNEFVMGVLNIDHGGFFFRPIKDISDEKYKKIEKWNRDRYNRL